MTAAVVIRAARDGEAEVLSALSRRSKAHWGYDKRFMALSQEALTIRDAWIAAGKVLVAECDGAVAGVAAIDADGDGHEVAAFFVDPAWMGHGIGNHLFDAMIDLAARSGIARLGILSDPNAAGFYEKMGARPVSMEPSDAIPGRKLPFLEIDIPRRRDEGPSRLKAAGHRSA